MSNQLLSRPGALPTWPAASTFSPNGLINYAHPAGAGYAPYAMPVSRAIGAKALLPTNGTAQVAGITLATAATAAGSWRFVLNSPLIATPVTVNVAVTNGMTAVDQATAVKAALTAAFAAKPQIGTVLNVTGGAGTAVVSVTAVRAAVNPIAPSVLFTLVASATGITGTTASATNTAGVLGTPGDFLGQLAIDPANAGAGSVKVCSNNLTNQWIALN